MAVRTEELEEVSLLFDFYGGLLTDKQRDIMEQHYEMDLSLGEIAENEHVSRQAIHDVVRRSTGSLQQFESELRLARRYRERRGQLETLSQEIASLKEAWLDGLATTQPPRSATESPNIQAALMRVERLVYALLQE